jgi:D-cysteine desulfhydrase
VVDSGVDLGAAMQKIASDLKAEGRKGYVIPGGGSNALGALGYVACAEELLGQTFAQGLKLDHIVCASGSAGTHAGLLTGLVGNNAQIPLTGINVRRPRAEQERNVHTLALDVAKLLGIEAAPREAVVALDEWVGPGYSLPTPEMIEAVRLLARGDGVLLDPVYTGKAMAGLIGLVRRGMFKKGENVLFLHTGGAPALYAYQNILQSE